MECYYNALSSTLQLLRPGYSMTNRKLPVCPHSSHPYSTIRCNLIALNTMELSLCRKKSSLICASLSFRPTLTSPNHNWYCYQGWSMAWAKYVLVLPIWSNVEKWVVFESVSWLTDGPGETWMVSFKERVVKFHSPFTHLSSWYWCLSICRGLILVVKTDSTDEGHW